MRNADFNKENVLFYTLSLVPSLTSIEYPATSNQQFSYSSYSLANAIMGLILIYEIIDRFRISNFGHWNLFDIWDL